MKNKYDIFISYRREGGYDTAKHLNDLLVRDGYKVSFDIDTLRNGDFDIQLLKRIDQCNDFILIVDIHAFDRTLDSTFNPKNDWMRNELAYALKKNKNIIPVFLSGVKGFPENLPKDVEGIIKKNGPEYNRYYFNDFYEKLKKSFLMSKPSHQKGRVYVFIVMLIALIGIIFFFCSKELSINDNQTVGHITTESSYRVINPDKIDTETRNLFINIVGRTPIYAVSYTEDTPIIVGLVNENIIDGELPDSKYIFQPNISLMRYHNDNGVWKKDFVKKIDFDKIIGEDDADVFCEFDNSPELFSASQQVYLYFHLSRTCGGNASANVTHDFIAINLMKGSCHFLEYVENLDSHYSENGTLYKEDKYPKGIEDLLSNKFSEQKEIQKIRKRDEE